MDRCVLYIQCVCIYAAAEEKKEVHRPIKSINVCDIYLIVIASSFVYVIDLFLNDRLNHC